MTEIPLPLPQIEREFSRSRTRSARRHNVDVLNSIERRQQRQDTIRLASKVVVGVVAFIGALDVLRLF